jgi:apolipoprotein N-acyltransferase
MESELMKKVAKYFPSFVSGVLITLAFPSIDLSFLAWVAFLPLLLSLWEKNGKESFAAGYIFGLTYFFGTLYWIYHSINHYGGVPFLASIAIVILFCLYLSLYPAIFSFLFFSMIRKTKLPGLFIAPVIWTVLEFLRSYALTGFPWASIGYSQYRFLHIIQIADVTGIYGISFLVLAVNGALADIFLLRKRVKEMPLFPISYTVVGFVSLALIAVFSLGYGTWRLGQERKGHLLKVGIVQGNIEQDKKWEPLYQKEVLDTYFSLSGKAAASSPQLVVWPETSVPFFFGYDAVDTETLVRFQRNLGSYLLFGSVLVQERSKEKTLLSNSAVLLDREGKIVDEYDKIHMVPFGEYVPVKSLLFFINKLVVGIGDYAPGKEYLRADTEFGSFATVICYEIIFPGLVRKFYTTGGDFIVNITNDAWFGKTSAPYQHFSMAVFRAIENRKPVIRSANTGISGIIDSGGRILSKTPLFQRMVVSGSVRTDSTMTFYTKYGDLFSYLCIVLFLILLININVWR